MTDGDAPPDPETARERMREGIAAVRREGAKAALIHASVDATAVLLAVALAVRVVEIPGLPATVVLPEAGDVATASVAGVVAGVVAFAVEAGYRLRQPVVERFETVNPELTEALRTARDALERDPGADGPMTRRLYAETVERLGEASSLGLIDTRRLAAALVLVAVLAPAGVGATAFEVGVDPFGGGGDDDATAPTAPEEEYEGLRNPSQVLGNAENVSAGDRTVEAAVSTQGTNGTAADRAYNRGGFVGGANGSVEGQQAGFAEQERIEEAELIREYNLRLREDDT